MGGIHTGGYSGPAIADNGASGYLDIGTVRIQWLIVANTIDGDQVFSLPVPFLNSSYSISVQTSDADWTAAATIGPWRVTAKTASSFTVNRDDDVTGTAQLDVIAIGRKP